MASFVSLTCQDGRLVAMSATGRLYIEGDGGEFVETDRWIVHPSKAEKDASPEVAKFECRNGQWTMRQAFMDELLARHPNVNVKEELRLAWRWCKDHEAKRKTVQGMKGFLERWMQNKEKDMAGTRKFAKKA